MFERVKAALEASGHSKKYLAKFQENEMDDSIVGQCLSVPGLISQLNEIIPILAHRVKFITEFKNYPEPSKKREHSQANPDLELSNNLNSLDLNTDHRRTTRSMARRVSDLENFVVVDNSIFEDSNWAENTQKNEIDLLVLETVKRYSVEMETKMKAKVLSEDDLEDLHMSTRRFHLENFDTLTSRTTQSNQRQAKEELIRQIESKWTETRQLIRKLNQDASILGHQLLQDSVEFYEEQMREYTGLEEEIFKQHHEDTRASVTLDLSQKSTNIRNTTLKDQILKDFSSQIGTIFLQKLLALKSRKEELQELTTKAKLHAQVIYEQEMFEFMGGESGKRFFDDVILHSKHSEKKMKAVDTFQSSLDQLESEFGTKILSTDLKVAHLNSAMDLFFENLLEKNRERSNQYILKSRNVLAEAKTLHATKLKELMNTCLEEEEVIELAKKLHDNIQGYLKSNTECPFAKPEFIASLNEDLTSHMTSHYEDHLELFQLRREEDELEVRRALFDAKMYYNEEMDKHFKSKDFLHPDVLSKLNDKICAAAIEISQQEIQLTENQEKQLRAAMRIVYLKYEEQNLMRLPGTPVIGIDLGTTYSCVAICVDGKVVVIRNECGLNTTPSYVGFQADGTTVVGEAAKSLSFRNPQNTIFDAKRLIGRKYNDPVIQGDIKNWPFQVVNDNDQPKIRLSTGKTHPPESISALVLKKMKKIAEDYMGRQVTDCVITVPALFNDGQRQATKDAGEIAGLNVLKIINEPTAAAIGYQLHRTDDLKRHVLIFDLGGGTFDVAVLKMMGDDIKVLAVHGNNHLGGEDFDMEMVNYCIEYVKRTHSVDLARGRTSTDVKLQYEASSRLRRIQNECEKQKRILSESLATNIVIDMIDDDLDMDVPFTRALFEKLNAERFNECIKIVEKSLKESKLSNGDIDDIVLVGGSTRIPAIQTMLTEFFDGKALSRRINPDEAVAHGAAIQASLLGTKTVDCFGYSLTIRDVTPLSIGVENHDNSFSIVIPKNSHIPCTKPQVRYPVHDYQTSVLLKVYEGEDLVAARNNLLGKFELTGIPPRKARQEKIDLTMNVSEEGILYVKAVCRSTGASNDLTIMANKQRMTREEIEAAKSVDIPWN